MLWLHIMHADASLSIGPRQGVVLLLRPLGIQPPLHRRRMDFFRKSFSFSLQEASTLGYTPKVALEEGMRATGRWYADHGLVSAGV